MPVSLGKPSTPSSSGTMVTMSHDYSTIFDTTREGPGGYRVQVYYAMRLTWGGEFIHAAPWSVGDQGHTNVSHGCVNMSDANSQWLFGITHVGDPVTVKGTEVQLSNGNGWTGWNQTWSDYVKGSAVPVPAQLAAGTTVASGSGTGAAAHPTPTR
jgi:L,D-transpeptidase catalytic domain